MAEAESLRSQLGRRIRQLRKTWDWTQDELAERAGLDTKYVGAVERGERNLSIDNVEKISDGLGVEAAQLFLFAADADVSDDHLSEARIRDLLDNSDGDQKRLMMRVLRDIASSAGG